MAVMSTSTIPTTLDITERDCIIIDSLFRNISGDLWGISENLDILRNQARTLPFNKYGHSSVYSRLTECELRDLDSLFSIPDFTSVEVCYIIASHSYYYCRGFVSPRALVYAYLNTANDAFKSLSLSARLQFDYKEYLRVLSESTHFIICRDSILVVPKILHKEI